MSWATTSDVDYLEDELGVASAHDLYHALKDVDLYRNEHTPGAGELNFPERRMDELEPDDAAYDDDAGQASIDEYGVDEGDTDE